MFKSPEFQQMRREKIASGEWKKSGRRPGVPDGYSWRKWKYIKRENKKFVNKVVKRLIEMKVFEPDNNVAKEAIETTVTILRQPGETRQKLQAAKILLEYTQKKPVQANEITLNKAEAFLDAVANDPDFDPSAESGSEGT